MKILNYTVVLTIEEAREMAADSIRGYTESLQMDGEPIPTENLVVEKLTVELA